MGRFVDQFFTQITGRDSPDSPAIVFLHGVMGYAMNWRKIAKVFEDRYRVLTFDARGHGRSVHGDVASNPGSYSPEGMAEDLKKILDDLGWKNVVLVGHSMGGRVAYAFAARWPGYVSKLVIEDIGPNMSPAGSSTVMRVLNAVPMPFADKRSAKVWFDSQFPKVFSDFRNAKALADWLYANVTEDENGRAVWRFDVEGVKEVVASGRSDRQWDDIRALSMPTLLMRGEFSSDLPRDVFDKILSENNKISGVEIQGAGHWVHSEKHDEFVAALTGFLKGSR